MSDRPEFVWVFDINHRVYERDAKGNSRGGPVWREHWRKRPVVGETSRSWVLSNDAKVPKVGADRRVFAFSEGEIDERAWVEAHKWRIADSVRNVDDVSVLQQIAALTGYKLEAR